MKWSLDSFYVKIGNLNGKYKRLVRWSFISVNIVYKLLRW